MLGAGLGGAALAMRGIHLIHGICPDGLPTFQIGQGDAGLFIRSPGAGEKDFGRAGLFRFRGAGDFKIRGALFGDNLNRNLLCLESRD